MILAENLPLCPTRRNRRDGLVTNLGGLSPQMLGRLSTAGTPKRPPVVLVLVGRPYFFPALPSTMISTVTWRLPASLTASHV